MKRESIAKLFDLATLIKFIWKKRTTIKLCEGLEQAIQAGDKLEKISDLKHYVDAKDLSRLMDSFKP